MCGIAGLWTAAAGGLPDIAGIAQSMAEALKHRGPDGAGTWSDLSAGVALSHRRLAIVDLSAAGLQPMLSHNHRYVLTYNGEIYNHNELRRELEEQGFARDWRGRSDTETLLACCSAWGITSALKKAVGMFALALWDSQDEVLYLARDRLGEKPLYFGWVGGGLAFGSELSALRQVPGFNNRIDRESLSLFMRFRSVPAPWSIYEGIGKILPGTITSFTRADVEARRTPLFQRYWSLPNLIGDTRKGAAASRDADATEELERHLRTSIERQQLSDVPVGAFLSGGVDSSTVVALMQSLSSRQINTYTVGFEVPEYDESLHAAAVARHLGTAHHELRVTAEHALSVVPRLHEISDEPFADSSQIVTFLISEAARQDVTVVLSGDGADELFGGYNRHVWAATTWNWFQAIPRTLRRAGGKSLLVVPSGVLDRLSVLRPDVRHLGEKAHKLARGMLSADSLTEFYLSFVGEWAADSGVVIGATGRLSHMHTPLRGQSPEEAFMYFDLSGYLPDDVLTKVDRAAMACSLETRTPYLDRDVVEFAATLPASMKVRDGTGKWLLRQVLHRHVPAALVERPKAGFAVPLADWLRGPLRGWAARLLDAARLEEEGFFDARQIQARWIDHQASRRDWSSSLWCVLMFQAWHERYHS